MSSKGAIKWLARLKEPRTIESLICEIYGEATWFGCLFEREVADLLNFYELTKSLREVSGAASSIRLLADSLDRNPQAAILGKPETPERK